MSNVAKIITDTILERMEQAEKDGTVFHWVKPFSEGSPDRPYSYDTQRPYSGINRLLLNNGEYLTYNKVQRLNEIKDGTQYQIRKGAKSNIVCYYNTVPVLDDCGEPEIDEFTGEEKRRGFLKYYRVFSREDIVERGNKDKVLPSKFNYKHYTHEEATERMREKLDRFNRLFNYYCKSKGIEIEIIQDGTQSYFSHDMKIRVPDISNFKSLYQWTHTLSHEMIHSTGMFLGRFDDKNQNSREREELIAEIGAEMLVAQLQIEDDSDTPDNTLAYIQSWSEYLKDKPGEIIAAATKSEAACNMILDCLREMELEEQKKEQEENER